MLKAGLQQPNPWSLWFAHPRLEHGHSLYHHSNHFLYLAVFLLGSGVASAQWLLGDRDVPDYIVIPHRDPPHHPRQCLGSRERIQNSAAGDVDEGPVS
jgi:predicted dehydrogenase